MAATSKHYGDVANWISKVIESCETLEQERTARNLVCQFESVYYRGMDHSTFWSISQKLRAQMDTKFYAMLDKKIKDNANTN